MSTDSTKTPAMLAAAALSQIATSLLTFSTPSESPSGPIPV